MIDISALNILLVEDQIMVQQALATLLSLEKNIQSVHTANDATKAQTILNHEPIDVLITDIEMPGISGIELCQWSAINHPEVKRIIITTFGRTGYIKRAMENKVDGFILKDLLPEDLIKCIKDVCLGKTIIDSDLLIDTFGFQEDLSKQERKVLLLAKEGKSNQEIADQLFLSLGTVKNYMSSCLAKLTATNRVEAIRVAEKKGLL